MKSWQSGASPWGRMVHFQEREFELMMDELRERAGADCFSEGSGVDVDLVLLRGLDVEAVYIDLPTHVMGRTRFERNGSVQIEISRALVDEAELDLLARRRLRTTLAHEGGHVVCHRPLFIEDVETIPLFDFGDDADRDARAILCRDESVGRLGYRGHWWEYQANQCMAALLLPRALLQPRVASQLQERRLPSFEEAVRTGDAKQVIRDLSNVFDVSHQAMLYRLQALGHVPDQRQRSLMLDV